jgi:hypothetical protein
MLGDIVLWWEEITDVGSGAFMMKLRSDLGKFADVPSIVR